MFRFFVPAFVALALVGGGVAYRIPLRDAVQAAFARAKVPPAVTADQAAQSKKTDAKIIAENKKEIPSEWNLAVPFTVQAPNANWDFPYKEACEEASVLMAKWFFEGKKLVTKEFTDKEILTLVEWEKKKFGYYEDTNAEQVAQMIREYAKRKARVVYNPRVEDIVREVAAGHPALVPAAGRMLKNPYFRSPGPIYHMLVIKGYTKNHEFIVNDPGTKRGADYIYPYARVMDAMHDWPQDGKIEEGRKAVVVVE